VYHAICVGLAGFWSDALAAQSRAYVAVFAGVDRLGWLEWAPA
jgi:hypothetical protein